MSTPDKFIFMNPDLQPGVVPRHDKHQVVRRPNNPPRTNKDFRKMLDDKDDRPTKDVNERAKEIAEERDRVRSRDPNMDRNKQRAAHVKETTEPELDPRYNQLFTVGKDSKVAPKLGKEMTIAPAEEPRAEGYLEGKDQKIAGLDPGELAKSMALEKQSLKLPKGEGAEGLGLKRPDQLLDKGKLHSSEGAINLMAGHAGEQGNIVSASAIQKAMGPEKAYQLMQLIADQISVAARESQTDTTIILKNLSMFSGARLTVTSYSSARGEINITFENLTQEAKLLLDLAENRAILKQSLDSRGFIVHMVTTSTTSERTYAEGGHVFKEGRGGAGEEMAQNDREKQQEKEQRDS